MHVSLGCSRLQGMWLITTTEKGEQISQSGPIQIKKQEGRTSFLMSTRRVETLKTEPDPFFETTVSTCSSTVSQLEQRNLNSPHCDKLNTYNLCSMYNLIFLSVVNIKITSCKICHIGLTFVVEITNIMH
jgi:hypothetical protein